jgi:hypothetical protein
LEDFSIYSAVDNFIAQLESHKYIALGLGSSDDKEAIRKHQGRIKTAIKEIEGRLPK